MHLAISCYSSLIVTSVKASGKTSFVNVLGSGQVRPHVNPACNDYLHPHMYVPVERGCCAHRRIQLEEGQKRERDPEDMGCSRYASSLQVTPVPRMCRPGLGQPRYRSIWERYCNGVDAVVCVHSSLHSCPTLTQVASQLRRGLCRCKESNNRLSTRAL